MTGVLRDVKVLRDDTVVWLSHHEEYIIHQGTKIVSCFVPGQTTGLTFRERKL